MYSEKRKKHTPLYGSLVLVLLVLVPLVLVLGSCEQIFTYSPLTWAQRDPSKLSDAQKVSYAQSILGSGASQEDLAAAYEAIADDPDPNVQLLASQVAVAASGINEAAATILESIETIDEAGITEALDSIDNDMLTNAISAMDAAEADPSTKETITSEDYLITAAAVLLAADEDLTESGTTFSDMEALISGTPTNNDDDPIEKSAYYLVEAGYDASDLEQLLNFDS